MGPVVPGSHRRRRPLDLAEPSPVPQAPLHPQLGFQKRPGRARLAEQGTAALQVWPTLLGAVMVYCGKLWFLDRMVWLYEKMKELHPPYRRWLY